MPVWQPAYIGLGSNLSDPAAQVRQALHGLAGLPRTLCVVVSRLYASRPMGPVSQPDFVNAVAGVLTQLTAVQLLRELRHREGQAGRPAVHEHWGPRIIDLDVLVFGAEQCSSSELVLPHPGVVERNFVLYPLGDLAPELDVPGLGRVAELRGRVTPEGLERLGEP